ncbi:MAG TPA: IPT/TIG domain-containing protein, partial [Blastocatellia bacterium]|nr:IPT/TIG domain-containing protein [Blastocatellia bacterium]
MMGEPEIESIVPSAGIEGGEIIIACKNFRFAAHDQARVTFGGVETRPVSASATRIIAPVPSDKLVHGSIDVTISANGATSGAKQFVAGRKLAENLHPVSNPAYDRDTGAIYSTLSGTRGQKIPVSVYKISGEGESEPFLTDVVNPTGLAFSPDGEMFITSRFDGSVYRITPFKEAEVFARNLGIATGITFDAEGKMYVGDRNGTIYTINDIGEATTFATLEPSIAAFHLAFGPDGFLYATGPTMSSFDSIMKIGHEGEV